MIPGDYIWLSDRGHMVGKVLWHDPSLYRVKVAMVIHGLPQFIWLDGNIKYRKLTDEDILLCRLRGDLNGL